MANWRPRSRTRRTEDGGGDIQKVALHLLFSSMNGTATMTNIQMAYLMAWGTGPRRAYQVVLRFLIVVIRNDMQMQMQVSISPPLSQISELTLKILIWESQMDNPLPILADSSNRIWIDPEEPLSEAGIYRDEWERRILGPNDYGAAATGKVSTN
ncbi:Phosphate metabolism transcription protein [Conoideocrella luteorostrata]|uniref:Phosphate metabolism transcription protein n=1 Tax=Conoideocrella luteorostrata TaxID=1105319 RepID=A0AAJ0CU81_9HYPO|nr:Phosphate metabolism transcription protein [Conoideocrella luteorostrata]